MTVPLVLKKITDDLKYLKNSLDIVRYEIEKYIKSSKIFDDFQD